MANIEANIKKLAKKYYGTDNLSSLSPYQLDKLVTWNTGRTVDYGKNKDRRAGRTAGRYLQGKL
tara:strand:- start:433 stop:624 length:192 start_codon:yes stop_codon:yes gene_type:complete